MPNWVGVELLVNPDKGRFCETSRYFFNFLSVIVLKKFISRFDRIQMGPPWDR